MEKSSRIRELIALINGSVASEVQNKSEVTNSVSHFENCKSEVLKVSKKKKELLKHEFKNHRVFINLAS